jgi:hypothetical protein
MDKDDENKGNEYREDAVDIVKAGEGYAVGYTQEGEWLEYTVNMASAGEFDLKVNYATTSENAGFKLYIDGEAATDDIILPQGSDWETYATFEAGKVNLPAGEHVLKLEIVGNYVNLDWLSIGETAPADSGSTMRIADSFAYRAGPAVYDVYGVTGKYVASFSSYGSAGVKAAARAAVRQSGVYLVKPRYGGHAYRIFVK